MPYTHKQDMQCNLMRFRAAETVVEYNCNIKFHNTSIHHIATIYILRQRHRRCVLRQPRRRQRHRRCILRRPCHRLLRQSCVDGDEASCADGASCVDGVAFIPADGSISSLPCELPLPCARPRCAVMTMAEVVANPTPFRSSTLHRSRREPPDSDDAGTSTAQPTTNNRKKPAHSIGSGDSRLSGGIQAAPIRGLHPNTGGLFVSRLAPNTSASSLKRHIKESCDVTAKYVAIKTKYDSYCSFRVFADSHLDRLLESSGWPMGVLVRDFI